MLGKRPSKPQAKKNEPPSVDPLVTSDLSHELKSEIEEVSDDIKSRVNSVIATVHGYVIESVDAAEVTDMAEAELRAYLRPVIGNVLNVQKIQLNAQEQSYLESQLIDEMVGLGPLEPLLADDGINDILVNGANQVYVEKLGKLVMTETKFRDDAQVLNIISRIVSRIGRRVDETTPYVDARLPDGSRVNAIIPPLAIDGPSISIRKFKAKKITLSDMVKSKNLSQAMVDLLSVATKSRQNIIVVGGTGSGKTTLLNALSLEIPEDDRIITIEDSAELQLQQPHVVRLETRPATIEGKGAITERHLVKNALRMRPDRIILGEIRSEEAFDMLQAMNTGHDGSMCTIHASNPREVPARLSNMVMMSGYEFPAKAILAQIASSVNILVQISRMRDGHRRVTNITEIVGLEGEVVVMQDLFSFEYTGEAPDGTLLGEFKFSGIQPKFTERAKEFGLAQRLNEALR